MGEDAFLEPILRFRWGPQSDQEAIAGAASIALQTGGLHGLGRRWSRQIRVPFLPPHYMDAPAEGDVCEMAVGYVFDVEVWNESGVITGEVTGRPPKEAYGHDR